MNEKHIATDYAVVFSGGGALGAWEVGCLKSVLEFHNGRAPSIVTGASAGAINAAGHHLGLTPEELGQLWNQLSRTDVFAESVNLKSLAKGIAASRVKNILMSYLGREDEGLFQTINSAFEGKRSIFDTSPLNKTLEEIFDHEDRTEAFSQAQSSLVISTTKLSDGKSELLYILKDNKRALPDGARRGRYADAWTPMTSMNMLKQSLIGTAALPILFPPMEGRFDGGVLLNQPIGPAILMGARLIYVFIPSTTSFGRTTHFFTLAQTLLSTWLTSSLNAQIRQVGANNKIYYDLLERISSENTEMRSKLESNIVRLCVIRPHTELGVGLLDFGQNVDEMIANAEQRTKQKLTNEFNYDDPETWDGFMDQDGRVL